MPSDIIDLQIALERVQNDAKFLLELLRDFERDFRAKRKLIAQAVERRDFAKLQETVHFVKGAAGNIAADPIHNSCMIVENLIKYQDMDLIKEMLIDIDRQFLELQAFIVEFRRKVG